MNKVCKEFVEKAKPYNGEEIDVLYIINSGKRYRGFWGPNEYNTIILIGRSRPKAKGDSFEFYKLSTEYQSDKLSIEYLREEERYNIDIDHRLNCVRVWFNQDVIRQGVLSDITLVPAKSEVAKKYGSF